MENVVYVYNKNHELLAKFDGNAEGLNEEEMKNLFVAPQIHIEQNGASTFSFQMLANSEKWQLIKDPENLYYVNGRYYTPLNEGSYKYSGNDSIRVVNVTLVETWYLLDRKYVQAYNCGLYCYAKATFQGWTIDGAIFKIQSIGCSNPSNTISNALAWKQVSLWRPEDNKGNKLFYTIISEKGTSSNSSTDEKYKELLPKNWKNNPPIVSFESFSVSGNTATVTIQSRATANKTQTFDYVSGGTYALESKPYPASLKNVYVNSTTKSETTIGNKTTITYNTSNKKANNVYIPSTGKFTLNYRAANNETINYVIAEYDFHNLGEISSGATCTFAYGAEVLDDHTFVILPKADIRYSLTIDGVEYPDNEVKDSRGTVMPRGSGGYAMWAALKNTGWSLGICDVIATDFDPKIDYGVFNIESDQKDVLYIIQYIQELYGGILDFDSVNKVLNYRAENNEDYQSYTDDGFNQWTGYEFREGKNMTDQPEVTVDNNLTTKAYILGYGGLNFKKVNNGKMYVEDYSYTDDVYEGYLEQSLIYDTNDEGGQRQLLYWAQKEIKKHASPRKTISLSVTDIRTVEGYEHEVFDINNIVRVYYKDEEGKKEVMEEQRITLWEYNPFAMWDCTVELGDKTQNLSELFKLIYNSAVENAPGTNASGQVSSSDITHGTTSGDIDDYISQTVSDNFSSVADLVIETNNNFAYAELFTQYQKTTDRLASDTYAGLTLYADEQISQLQLIVSGNYQTLQGEINNIKTETKAGFEAQQEQNEAYSRQFSSLTTTTTNLQGQITSVKNAQASLETRVTTEYASISMLNSYAKLDYVNNQITNSVSGFYSYADAASSEAVMTAKSYVDDNFMGSAQVKAYVDEAIQTVDIRAIGGRGEQGYVNVSSAGGVTIGGYGTTTIESESACRITSSNFYVDSSMRISEQMTYLGRAVSWITINGVAVLGY